MSHVQIKSGGRWTRDGRWVVIGPMFGRPVIIHDPGGDDWESLQDCLAFVRNLPSNPSDPE